jgi:hypothetical protein
MDPNRQGRESGRGSQGLHRFWSAHWVQFRRRLLEYIKPDSSILSSSVLPLLWDFPHQNWSHEETRIFYVASCLSPSAYSGTWHRLDIQQNHTKHQEPEKKGNNYCSLLDIAVHTNVPLKEIIALCNNMVYFLLLTWVHPGSNSALLKHAHMAGKAFMTH